MSDTVLCKDCKHSFRIWYDIIFGGSKRYTMRCRKAYKQSEEEIDLVVGPKIKKEHYETCGTARIFKDMCGPEGKNWQPKDPKKMFFYMKRVTSE